MAKALKEVLKNTNICTDRLEVILQEIFSNKLKIEWPPHLFMPEDAVRFGRADGGTSAGTGEQLIWSQVIPASSMAVIHSIYGSPNVALTWILKVNGSPDPEYGNINWASLDPNTDGWLMPLGKSRIIVRGESKIEFKLSSASAVAYRYLVRGYYWNVPVENKE
jgi:hypothetical protein